MKRGGRKPKSTRARSKGRRAPTPPVLARSSAITPAPPPPPRPRELPPTQVMAARELFWHNVIREILTSLSMLSSLRSSAEQRQLPAPKDESAPPTGDSGTPDGAAAPQEVTTRPETPEPDDARPR